MKTLWKLITYLAILSILAACTGQPSPAPEQPAEQPAATQAPAEPEEEPAATEPAEEPAEEPAATEPAAEAEGEATGETTAVSLQLQWVPQSQFAGYYAALDQGFYTDEGLDVTIKPGAVEIVPQQVVATGGAEFGIAWVPKVLASREQGADLVNIAQVFQRSGTLEISWADSGITEPEDWRGKRVGTWGFGNEPELFAAMRQAGIDPNNTEDVTIVQQPFDMSLLLNREVDAAQAMTYNEYAQVLEATNPETGELYQPEDLNVISFEEVGTAMLQDAIFVRGDWIADEANQDVALRFLRASFRGWIYCRDNPDSCVEIVLAAGTALGQGHMTWMMNEINALIWPSPEGIGIMDPEAWAQTAEIAEQFDIIQAAPDEAAYRTDLAEQAVADLEAEGVDTRGEDWEKAVVEVTPGGE
ncbi:MAG TPA: ABC transporter substrate-binding protein [Ardenticatenaceae bacterium]|nr:ABC transporter substrate-binding protein [Ardenticatenaceae bacterium]